MRITLLIATLTLLFSSCKSKESIPGNIIPQKKMQALLWDMMRADQFLSDYVLNRDSSLNKEIESTKYYSKIFALHDVSKDEFQRSFSFYRSRPALMKAIMDSISAPAVTATVLQPDQVTTPLAVPDSTIRPVKPVPADTSAPIRMRPDSLRRRIKPVVAY